MSKTILRGRLQRSTAEVASRAWRDPLQRRGPAIEAALAGVMIVVVHLLLGPAAHLLGSQIDDGAYMGLAESLVSGEGYRSIWYVGDPIQVKFPPVVPLIFSVAWLVGGDLATADSIARGLTLLATGAAAGAIWYLGTTRYGLARPLVLLFAITPFLLESVLQHFSLPVSEPFFMLAWALALLLWRRERAGTPAVTPGQAVSVGLCIGAAILTRGQGVALLPAFALAAVMLRLPWGRAGLMVVAAILPWGLWRLYASVQAAGGYVLQEFDEVTYASWIGSYGVAAVAEHVGRTALLNLIMYGRLFASYLADVSVVGVVLVGAWLTFVISGGIRLLRERPALVLSTALVIFVVLLFPWFDPRYLTVALPFAGLILATRAQRELEVASPLGRRVITGLLAIVAALFAVRQVTMRLGTNAALAGGDSPATFVTGYQLGRSSEFIDTAATWVRQSTAATDRILTGWPSAIYLHTGRKTRNADPGETGMGPSVFDDPGRYVASRIVNDGITVVITSHQRSGTTRDVREILVVCPGVLHRQDAGADDELPAFYRVSRETTCLQERILSR